jgi:hypothetical protein
MTAVFDQSKIMVKANLLYRCDIGWDSESMLDKYRFGIGSDESFYFLWIDI